MTFTSTSAVRRRWLFVPVALLLVAGRWTDARPAETEEVSAEFAAPRPSVATVPLRMLTDPDSAFGRVLRGRLAAMSDRDLSILESGLPDAGSRQPDAAPAAANTDDEMMMGDMPSLDDTQELSSSPVNLQHSGHVTVLPDINGETVQQARESPVSEDPEDRNKKLRLKTIQNQIINFMGWGARTTHLQSPPAKPFPTSPTPITSSQQRDAIRLLYENVNNFPTFPTDTFTEKTQSFYPICDLPKHTNEEIWNAKESMNLMFNITLPKVSKGILVNINMASLRLYKQLVSCNSQSSNETEDFQSCQPTMSEEISKRSNLSSTEFPLTLEDRQIRVSIYAYMRSLKKKRAIRRKLLDSRMMPYYGEKWTEWNIRNAIKIWRWDPIRNYGISIEVEDEDGNLLPVNRFFKPMNCTGDAQTATSKPIPGFLVEAVQNSYSFPTVGPNSTTLNAVLGFNNHRYPMIDVTTIEVPESEAHNAAQYQYAKKAFEQNLAGKVSQPGSTDDQIAQHRIRHSNRHNRVNSTESQEGGGDIRDQIIVKEILHRSFKEPPTEIPD